jgi:hypothetical protein
MPGYFLGQPTVATAQGHLHTFAQEIFVSRDFISPEAFEIFLSRGHTADSLDITFG